MRRSLVVAGMMVTLMVFAASPARATIHPLVQSVACAAAQAWENVSVGNPPGQTPVDLTEENLSVVGTQLTIAFPTPLTFDQSDFRAMIATGFVDTVVKDANGDVTALVVDFTSVPKAVSGQGGLHCATAA